MLAVMCQKSRREINANAERKNPESQKQGQKTDFVKGLVKYFDHLLCV